MKLSLSTSFSWIPHFEPRAHCYLGRPDGKQVPAILLQTQDLIFVQQVLLHTQTSSQTLSVLLFKKKIFILGLDVVHNLNPSTLETGRSLGVLVSLFYLVRHCLKTIKSLFWAHVQDVMLSWKTEQFYLLSTKFNLIEPLCNFPTLISYLCLYGYS